MVLIFGLGVFTSAYIVYKNRSNLTLRLLKIYLDLEQFYLKYRGNIITYLLPEESTRSFNQINSSIEGIENYFNKIDLKNDIDSKKLIINKDFLSDYIQNIQIENRHFSFLFNIKNRLSSVDVDDNYIKFKSPIICVTVDVLINNNSIYKEYDITEYINRFVNYNSNIELNNINKNNKKFWIYYLNYILKERNAHISYDTLDSVKLYFSLMTDKIENYNGNIRIIVEYGNVKISEIESTEEELNRSTELSNDPNVEDNNNCDLNNNSSSSLENIEVLEIEKKYN